MTNGSVFRSSGQDVSLENEDAEMPERNDSLSGFEMDPKQILQQILKSCLLKSAQWGFTGITGS